jgi:hypothetical protein
MASIEMAMDMGVSKRLNTIGAVALASSGIIGTRYLAVQQGEVKLNNERILNYCRELQDKRDYGVSIPVDEVCRGVDLFSR